MTGSEQPAKQITPAITSKSASLAPVLYVNVNADGAEDGNSWSGAFTDLQLALLSADAGNQIWVAAGTYTPAPPNGDRGVTFALPAGVAIYGGFLGDEANPDARDPWKHETILSGDLKGDDGMNFANLADNSLIVVSGWGGMDETTLLDGFVISGGNGDYAAGMAVEASSPLVKNCVFRRNHANLGAAAFVRGESAVVFANCVFEDNSASDLGGAVFVREAASPVFLNCVFRNNKAANCGGAFFVREQAHVQAVNCLFTGNYSADGGAAFARENSRLTLGNCTVVQNMTRDDAGAVFGRENANLELSNSVLWDNRSLAGRGEISQMFVRDDARVVLRCCCVHGVAGTLTEQGNFGNNPLLSADYRPLNDSPCIDGGELVALPEDRADLDGDGDRNEPLPFDLAGQPRVCESSVDIGAFEWCPEKQQQ
jgi:hypothetical protein